jgi:hypothetical protein
MRLYLGYNTYKETKEYTANEKQDYMSENSNVLTHKQLLEYCKQLEIEVLPYSVFHNFTPNHQSDYCRWAILRLIGGWYFDIDQIFVRPLDNNKFNNTGIIYGCKTHPYAGVLGCGDTYLAHLLLSQLLDLQYSDNSYCDYGNWFFQDVLKGIKYERNTKLKERLSDFHNTEDIVFYPITESSDAKLLYEGEVNLTDFAKQGSYTVHWFGGHPDSQAFNKEVNWKYIKFSDDSISKYLRSIDILTWLGNK